IIVVGLILRLWGIDFGLPFQFHQDEPIVVNHALAFGSGDLNPHFFNIPPLTSYILFVIYAGYYLIGMLCGLFNTPDTFIVNIFKNPSVIYILGRVAIGIIPGTLCIFFVYKFAKNIFSKTIALYAALIMSVCSLNVVNSHYIYADMLLVLFIVISCSCIFNMFKNPSMKAYIIAAIFLGLAISTKYNAAVLGVTFFLAHIFIILKEKRRYFEIIFSKKLFLGISTVLFVFIFTNPYSIISFREFFSSFTNQAQATWYMGWQHHITYSLNESVSFPVLLFGAMGLLFVLLRHKAKGALFVSFPVVFYLSLVFFSQSFPRYVLALVPFVAIGAAYFIFDVLGSYCKSAFSKVSLSLLAVFLIVPMFAFSIKSDALFSSKDTRVISANWIKDNLPLGSKIACDSTFFRPALEQPYSQIREKIGVLNKQPALKGLKTKKLELQLKSMDENYVGFPIYFLAQDPASQGQFLNTTPALDLDVYALMQSGIDYVTIDYAWMDNTKEAFIKTLKQNSTLINSFSPYYDESIRLPYDKFELTCLPLGRQELLSRNRTGQALEIYKLKK
ncbi:MAG: glycosyltransferase family 39 protein, partial [Candidatus Omnitrophica bacterium]|nr:glycosyltransferase family 39 protein [Candidatus Omnitrophota bacterium]